MSDSLRDRQVVLGVTGSIAAFKAVALASDLVKAGALVDVVMTRAATEFVTPLSFRAITHRPVVTDLWAPDAELEIGHVTLGRRAELVAVVPATADAIARLAHGLAADALGTTVLASQAPLLIAPAMEPHMWANAATQANVATLEARGARFVGPGEGRMASGHVGRGRMAEPDEIRAEIERLLARGRDLAGRRVVVTAGGTQEPIDPVRYIGNRSTGKMGFALAEAARDRGAAVTLIVGATTAPLPPGVEVVRVGTTLELQAAVRRAIQSAQALIMAAAPADFRVEVQSDRKIKRGAGSLALTLVPNPDILASIADWTGFKVGFAAETDDLIAHAREKLARKKVDVIVANDVTREGSGFGSDTNEVTFLFEDGRVEPRPIAPKREVAEAILDLVVAGLAARDAAPGPALAARR
jgi:phosphopantothenoylcysteine decarboxylase/phosphopantothenate--cysteine ligase